LELVAPAEETPDRFVYDPDNPVPTCGGNTLIIPMGVQDQRQVETRQDVLVYTSAPVAAPLEVTGPMVVKLFASSSAVDTDFTAKLVDVRPDGYAQNLADGVLRARYRASRMRPAVLTPDQVYGLTIDLWATSHVFLPGHRVRLEISSSNFPRFDRNLNTGEDHEQSAARGRADDFTRQPLPLSHIAAGDSPVAESSRDVEMQRRSGAPLTVLQFYLREIGSGKR